MGPDAVGPSLFDTLPPVVLWAAVVTVAAAFAWFLWGRLREMGEEEVEHNRPGRVGCPRCGYDVHRTPTRCPECGLEWPIPKEQLMPIYSIPEESGPFVVVRGNDGQFAVAEEAAAGGGKNAAKLGMVFIPCRDEPQAETIRDKLNSGDHDGTVQVDLLSMPAGGGND